MWNCCNCWTFVPPTGKTWLNAFRDYTLCTCIKPERGKNIQMLQQVHTNDLHTILQVIYLCGELFNSTKNVTYLCSLIIILLNGHLNIIILHMLMAKCFYFVCLSFKVICVCYEQKRERWTERQFHHIMKLHINIYLFDKLLLKNINLKHNLGKSVQK